MPAAVFGLLAWILEHGSVFEFDWPLQLAVHAIAGSVLDRLAWWLARVGYGYGVIPFGVVLVAVSSVRRRFRDAGFVFAAIGGSLLLNIALRIAFARPRPTLWVPAEIQHSFGFPSGHAMADATLAVVVTALAWSGRWRWPVIILSTAFALLVGASRIYNGVHYPSDVLAGWCAGMAWGIAMHMLVFRSPRSFTSMDARR